VDDLHILPRIRDSWSYLYVEHCKIDQEAKAIAIHDATGRTPVPCAALSLLMLGPGTSVTHAAIRTLAESGCLVAWTGEEGVRFYAQGLGETRSARHLIHQAKLVSDPATRLRVVRKMYEVRFSEKLDPGWTLAQIRGLEGVRVRQAYARASRETGIPWQGRSYKRSDWASADPVNRALSTANSCLYGVAHAAIVAAGYSPGLGFIHTGHVRSFVLDIADLYKTEITIPAAFQAVGEGDGQLEARVRYHCRDRFRESRLLARIVDDIERVLTVEGVEEQEMEPDFDREQGMPGGIWDPEAGVLEGGVNFADEFEEEDEERP
jgi:CRISPR-associated protein Cas1